MHIRRSKPDRLASGPLSGLVLALAIAAGAAHQAAAEPIEAADVRVIDGDTIRIFNVQPNVRLVGFNAPETRRARCDAERELGDRATRRVRDLVRAGNLDYEPIACSCPTGTEGTTACNYGRDCGTLKANGRDVGAILIEEGLAVPFICGATRCPKTPKPWCKSTP
jgi:endonuclease YncB( thermonuclease family)